MQKYFLSGILFLHEFIVIRYVCKNLNEKVHVCIIFTPAIGEIFLKGLF